MAQTENGQLQLAVNGTLMRGLALNQNLLRVGAMFVRAAKTDSNYRLWSIQDRYPAMIRDTNGGTEISLEIWSLSPAALASVLQQEPPGLCIGRLSLSTGDQVLGVLGEPYVCMGHPEITQYGGWRKYMAQIS